MPAPGAAPAAGSGQGEGGDNLYRPGSRDRYGGHGELNTAEAEKITAGRIGD